MQRWTHGIELRQIKKKSQHRKAKQMSNTDLSLKPRVKQFGILTYECYMISEIVVSKCRKFEDNKDV